MSDLSQSRLGVPLQASQGSVLGRYKHAGIVTRAFLAARWVATRYQAMAELFPRQGKILDVGCGHGLLSLALAQGSAARQVHGIDHDTTRISQATLAAQGVPNVSFAIGDFSFLENQAGWDAIAMIDVLHYFRYPAQEEIVGNAFKALAPGGTLIFREVDPNAGAVSVINRIHEKVMTTVGITKAEELHFRSVPEWAEVAVKAGFRVESRPFAHFPFADVIFLCRKASS